MNITWVSAYTDEPGDQQADLADGYWALIGPEARRASWAWSVIDSGTGDSAGDSAGSGPLTEEQAKAAVQRWADSYEREQREREINESASFLPALTGDEKPAMRVGGALVFAYVENGALVVSVDLDEAEAGAFALYGPDGCVPVRVSIGSTTIYDAGANR